MSPVLEASAANVHRAAALLREGKLVAFPTETVYGLGADADNAAAVARVFTTKGRPARHPLIVHIGKVHHLDRWASNIPRAAWLLAERFWPGPLTVVLKRARRVLGAVTGGQDTVAVRIPDHPVALALLWDFKGGVAAPSANRFGRISPTSSAHVVAELGGRVDCVLDGGPCSVGLESTILDLCANQPRILRPGTIAPAMLAELLGEMPLYAGPSAPRAPGALPAHYAPIAPLRVLAGPLIAPALGSLLAAGRTVAALSARPPVIAGCRWQTMPADPDGYGRELYARLREADAPDCDCIVVEQPPLEWQWAAIHDRLKRAAEAARRQLGPL